MLHRRVELAFVVLVCLTFTGCSDGGSGSSPGTALDVATLSEPGPHPVGETQLVLVDALRRPTALVPAASVVDTIRILTQVVLPTVAKGVLVRRPKVVAIAERLDVDRRAVRCLERARERYGAARFSSVRRCGARRWSSSRRTSVGCWTVLRSRSRRRAARSRRRSRTSSREPYSRRTGPSAPGGDA